MKKRDLVLCALNHEENNIPLWHMGFENVDTAQRLIGEDNVPTDLYPVKEYKKGASDKINMERNILYAEQIDSCVIGIGRGGNFAFGHGGPGEFLDRLVDKGDNYCISCYETGVKKEIRKNPHFYRHFDYPALCISTLKDMTFPDSKDQSRYEGIEDEVGFYKDRGYFTYANINGFFSGLHYFLCPYDKLLVHLLLEPDLVKDMLKKLGEFNLTAAENLLKRGVDCITFCDDLGSGNSLLFSPDLYEKFFFKWHAELAALCHSYGAYVHMHSHGDINKIIGKIVQTGIDMINPCDPYENMNMKELKDNYGDRITFVGGVNKFFFEWDYQKMKDSLEELISIGKSHGGYIFMDSSGGIPENVTKDKFNHFMEISKSTRYIR